MAFEDDRTSIEDSREAAASASAKAPRLEFEAPSSTRQLFTADGQAYGASRADSPSSSSAPDGHTPSLTRGSSAYMSGSRSSAAATPSSTTSASDRLPGIAHLDRYLSAPWLGQAEQQQQQQQQHPSPHSSAGEAPAASRPLPPRLGNLGSAHSPLHGPSSGSPVQRSPPAMFDDGPRSLDRSALHPSFGAGQASLGEAAEGRRHSLTSSSRSPIPPPPFHGQASAGLDGRRSISPRWDTREGGTLPSPPPVASLGQARSRYMDDGFRHPSGRVGADAEPSPPGVSSLPFWPAGRPALPPFQAQRRPSFDTLDEEYAPPAADSGSFKRKASLVDSRQASGNVPTSQHRKYTYHPESDARHHEASSEEQHRHIESAMADEWERRGRAVLSRPSSPPYYARAPPRPEDASYRGEERGPYARELAASCDTSSYSALLTPSSLHAVYRPPASSNNSPNYHGQRLSGSSSLAYDDHSHPKQFYGEASGVSAPQQEYRYGPGLIYPTPPNASYARPAPSLPPMPSVSTTRAAPPAQAQPRKRGKLPKQVTDLLKTWLLDHAMHPYPTDEEKHRLCAATGLTTNQVSNWFINARRRILVPTASGGFSISENADRPHILQAGTSQTRAAYPRNPADPWGR